MSFLFVTGDLFSFLLLVALAAVVLGTPLLLIGATLLQSFAPGKRSMMIESEEGDNQMKNPLLPVANQQFSARPEIRRTLIPSRLAK